MRMLPTLPCFHYSKRLPLRWTWQVGLVVCTLAFACTPQGDPQLPSAGLFDDFNGGALRSWWRNTGANYSVRGGQLRVQGAHNRPLWLQRRLPHDVRIDFDAQSDSPEGDIKFEIFGDGFAKATSAHYVATSYVVILGGWGNRANLVARLDEHGSGVVHGPHTRIEPGRRYHIRTERRDATLCVWVDGALWMRYRDPDPLSGPGHDHFAFNNWNASLSFDNLRIRPL